MNIFRPQVPYVFRPPLYSPVLAPILSRVSDHFFMRRKYRIRNVEIVGAEKTADLIRQGHSVLVTPNHGDHADPHVLVHAGRKHGLRFHFMGALEGF